MRLRAREGYLSYYDLDDQVVIMGSASGLHLASGAAAGLVPAAVGQRGSQYNKTKHLYGESLITTVDYGFFVLLPGITDLEFRKGTRKITSDTHYQHNDLHWLVGLRLL